jgi:hypothetical protein
MGGNSGFGIDHISESIETIFGLKTLKFFDADADPGSGMEKFGSVIQNKYPGSATMSSSVLLSHHNVIINSSLNSPCQSFPKLTFLLQS